MIEELQAIKEQLFDAPTEVKESFNNLVGYFDGKGKSYEYWIIKEICKLSNEEGVTKFRIVTNRVFKNSLHLNKEPKVGLTFINWPCTYTILAGPYNNYDDAEKKLSEFNKS